MIFSRDLVVFLFLDTFESRKCLETGEMTKSLENNDFFLFPDPFEKGKCLETGKRRNPLTTESVKKQGKRQNPLSTESV